MSILEDLELLDIPDDLPYMTDFDLDDILFEFSTPGLFDPSPAPQPVVEESVSSTAEEIPFLENCGGIPIEAVLPENEEAPPQEELPLDEAPVAEDVSTAEEPAPEEDEHPESLEDPFSIGDILYEFGTPTDEEGVKVYVPASKAKPAAEEDAKVYTPTRAKPVQVPVVEETIPFTALQEETSVIEEVLHEEVSVKASVPKAPGLFTKAAGMLMGLFGRKKSVEPAPALQAESVEDPFPVSLFEDSTAEEDGDLLLMEVAEDAADEVSPEDVSLFDFFAEAEENEEIFTAEENTAAAEEMITEEPPSLLAEEALPTEVEALSTKDGEAVESPTVLFPAEALVAEQSDDESNLDTAETILFSALQEDEPAREAAEPPAEEVPKTHGLFAKAAGLLMGLFGRKKPAEPAPALQPEPKEDPFPVSLFEDYEEDWNDYDEEEEDLTVPEDVAEAPADPLDQISFFDIEDAAEASVPEADLLSAEEVTEEASTELEGPLFEEAQSAEEAEEPILTEAALPAQEASADEEEGFSLEEIVTELMAIPVEEEENTLLITEEVEESLPEVTPEEEPAAEPDAVDVMMAELIGAAMETLRAEASAPEETDAPADALLLEMEEDASDITENFSIEEIVAELSDNMPDFDMSDTITFPAVPHTAAPEITPAAAAPAKGPGLLTKAAGAVMGLLAGLKKKPAPAPARASHPAPAEDASYDYIAKLFTEESDAADSDLMLELELLAEMEEEKEAARAAWEAEERILSIPEPEQEVPEAIALLQQEADEAAELARLEAEREAAELAALEAAREEAMLAQAEEELFEWIESTNKFRGKAIAKEELPVCQGEEDEEIPTYTMQVELPDEASAELVSAPILAEEEEAEEQPTMGLSDEESSAEILSLLENPDTEQSGTDESEEEASARRAKADEELRYVPDEPPAKAIGSHIGKRFGAAFAAFTGIADDASDDEEALGPEVTPTKAYKFYNRFVNGYRFRLRLSAALSVIMGWIALGLPVFGSLKNPAVSAALCLMILLTVMLAGADILVSGVRSLINRRPGIHSLVTISCLASVVDAASIIITKGAGGYLPFCAVSAVSMCFAIYGSLLYCRSQRLNFKTLEQCMEPLTISVDYGIVDEETTTVYRTIGAPESYIHRSEEEDLSETVYGIITPMLMAGIPVLALIAALVSKSFGSFFHIIAAMFAASASFSALVAFPLPYFLTQRDLYSTKAAIAGWAGTKEIGKVSSMIVTDRDLFPDETVSIKSVRIVDEVNPDLTLSYFCSMIKKSGSCLVPAFDQLAENNDCQLREVENFQCHEAGGLSGTIGPDEVLIASHSYMKLRGFRIPARKKDSENALFMAANGHVIAYIVVEYKPIKSVRAGLESALRGSVEMVFAARDFNITPMLIAKKFKSPTDTLRFPSYNQRYEITDRSGSETSVCAAVVSRKSFYSYAAVVEKARYLYRSVSWAVTLSAVSTVLGVLLMFIMALTGAGLTVGRLLIFMLLWLVPTLALAISISK